MIPGTKINSIFMVCKINQFVDYTDVLKTNLTDFMNKITSIVHQCAFRWNGWANTTEGDKFVITWKLPDLDTSSNDFFFISQRKAQNDYFHFFQKSTRQSTPP